MPIFQIKYKIKGTGYLQFEADSEDEALEEFHRAICNEECQNDDNSWIDQDVVYDLEWDEEVLDVSEV